MVRRTRTDRGLQGLPASERAVPLAQLAEQTQAQPAPPADEVGIRCRLGPVELCWSRTPTGSRTALAELLSDIGIQRELAGLPGWSRRGSTLTKTYRFATFPAAITFVTRVADVAESMDHHPDIDIRHTRLTFTLSTHDAGGITSNDLSLAREIERLATDSGIVARPE